MAEPVLLKSIGLNCPMICPFSNVKISGFQVPPKSPTRLWLHDVPPQLTHFARLYHHRGLGEVVGSSTPDKDAGNRRVGGSCWGTLEKLVISSNCPWIGLRDCFSITLPCFLEKNRWFLEFLVDVPSNQEISSAEGDVCRKDGDSPGAGGSK